MKNGYLQMAAENQLFSALNMLSKSTNQTLIFTATTFSTILPPLSKMLNYLQAQAYE